MAHTVFFPNARLLPTRVAFWTVVGICIERNAKAQPLSHPFSTFCQHVKASTNESVIPAFLDISLPIVMFNTFGK